MQMKNWVFSLFCFIFLFSTEKIHAQSIYVQLRSLYENMETNDIEALPYIRKYIQKAKEEKNFTELKNAYEDYSSFVQANNDKLIYADSAIAAAKKTKNNELISSAFLYKGSLHYFHFRNYKAALKEYLNAYDYSKPNGDDYLHHKILYQMGLVKNYLGFYDEAIVLFKQCIVYFELRTQKNNHPNQVFNDSKGYLNSMHQAIISYQYNGRHKKADSIIRIALNFPNLSEFPLEQAYFKKSKAISDYYHKNYTSAIDNLRKVLSVLKKNEDLYWISVSQFYIGKSLLKIGDEKHAIQEFEKTDTIFRENQFVFPELQENYELLIAYYNKQNDLKKERFYSQTLREVNKLREDDFPLLSSKIHKNYDNKRLKVEKDRLKFWSTSTIVVLVLIVLFLSFLLWKYYKKKGTNNQKELDRKINMQQDSNLLNHSTTRFHPSSLLSAEVRLQIENNLVNFEINKDYRESNFTIEKLAKSFGTNKSYLSRYINETKGMEFNKYISILRINYITQLLVENPKYRNWKIQVLAEECGINTRQNFSDLFNEINGIRPAKFIKQINAEKEDRNSNS